MKNVKSWPKDYSDQEIGDIITNGDSGQANGMSSWKEAGFYELSLRQKRDGEIIGKKNFLVSVVAAIFAFLSFLLTFLK